MKKLILYYLSITVENPVHILATFLSFYDLEFMLFAQNMLVQQVNTATFAVSLSKKKKIQLIFFKNILLNIKVFKKKMVYLIKKK